MKTKTIGERIEARFHDQPELKGIGKEIDSELAPLLASHAELVECLSVLLAPSMDKVNANNALSRARALAESRKG